jgi:hypothetical protein
LQLFSNDRWLFTLHVRGIVVVLYVGCSQTKANMTCHKSPRERNASGVRKKQVDRENGHCINQSSQSQRADTVRGKPSENEGRQQTWIQMEEFSRIPLQPL